MIVRIATEGQYVFPDEQTDRLNELDVAGVMARVQAGAGADLEHATARLLDERTAARGEAGALSEPEERVIERGEEALGGRRHVLPNGRPPLRIPNPESGPRR